MNLIREFSDTGFKQQPPPIEVDGEQDFKVEVMVGHGIFRGQPLYMVEFGYNSSEHLVGREVAI